VLTPIFVDEYLLVLDKPVGLLSVPGRGADKADCLWARAQQQWSDALVVHRLDMATSGLLLFARSAPMQRRLSMAFAAREVDKGYVAVVAGLIKDDEGEIDLPLAADWPRRPLQIIDPVRGKPALTRWRVLARDEAAMRTRLALSPVTGRSHQLRVHLHAIGHGIVGDHLYGAAAAATTAPRLLLHAERLQLLHPQQGQSLSLHCAAPF
jgi:tRNA pseudouridine32 synthase / 23S rRNA pseudouridine746 synthase